MLVGHLAAAMEDVLSLHACDSRAMLVQAWGNSLGFSERQPLLSLYCYHYPFSAICKQAEALLLDLLMIVSMLGMCHNGLCGSGGEARLASESGFRSRILPPTPLQRPHTPNTS